MMLPGYIEDMQTCMRIQACYECGDLVGCPNCWHSPQVYMIEHQHCGWDCFTPMCPECGTRGPVNIKYKDAAIERWNSRTGVSLDLVKHEAAVHARHQQLTDLRAKLLALPSGASALELLHAAEGLLRVP